MNLKGKRIFITGGSGFVGGRLVETLVLDHQAKVRALVHRAYSGALRMARFNIEFAHGDITDPEAMRQATEGCDVIIHLAYGRSGTVAQPLRPSNAKTNAAPKMREGERKLRRFTIGRGTDENGGRGARPTPAVLI